MAVFVRMEEADKLGCRCLVDGHGPGEPKDCSGFRAAVHEHSQQMSPAIVFFLLFTSAMIY